MIQAANPIQTSLVRQANHWLQAASRLSSLDHLASANAWQGIEHEMISILRKSMQHSINEVVSLAKNIVSELKSDCDAGKLRIAKRTLTLLREKYLKAEETIQFYTVAINSRTTPEVASLLRACDILCIKSMQELLQPLGKASPSVLTYIDKGIGASILKAGLRLWDGSMSTLAAIKVTQHNLFRPTAIIHETGHQIADILNWNEELAQSFRKNLSMHSPLVSGAFASWASEIAADAFAFVHTGYAAVAALHDVVSGTPQSVFSFRAHDPHPIAYVRVLLGIEMCRQFYGAGAWDDLEFSFKNDYDIDLVSFQSVGLIKMCTQALPDAVRIILKTSFKSFSGQALSQIISPMKVSPQELQKLQYIAGPALFTSHAWVSRECIRLLAITGYKIALGQGELAAVYKLQEEWMIRLGFAIQLN